MQIVVDTDVVSFLFKNHPICLRYDPELAGRVALISFMTVAEVERWAIQYHWANIDSTGCTCTSAGSPWFHPARTFAASGPK